MGQAARNHGGTLGHGYRNSPEGISDSVLFASVKQNARKPPINRKVEIVTQAEFDRIQSGIQGSTKQCFGIVWKKNLQINKHMCQVKKDLQSHVRKVKEVKVPKDPLNDQVSDEKEIHATTVQENQVEKVLPIKMKCEVRIQGESQHLWPMKKKVMQVTNKQKNQEMKSVHIHHNKSNMKDLPKQSQKETKLTEHENLNPKAKTQSLEVRQTEIIVKRENLK